jgi:hypothetical protein
MVKVEDQQTPQKRKQKEVFGGESPLYSSDEEKESSSKQPRRSRRHRHKREKKYSNESAKAKEDVKAKKSLTPQKRSYQEADKASIQLRARKIDYVKNKRNRISKDKASSASSSASPRSLISPNGRASVPMSAATTATAKKISRTNDAASEVGDTQGISRFAVAERNSESANSTQLVTPLQAVEEILINQKEQHDRIDDNLSEASAQKQLRSALKSIPSHEKGEASDSGEEEHVQPRALIGDLERKKVQLNSASSNDIANDDVSEQNKISYLVEILSKVTKSNRDDHNKEVPERDPVKSPWKAYPQEQINIDDQLPQQRTAARSNIEAAAGPQEQFPLFSQLSKRPSVAIAGVSTTIAPPLNFSDENITDQDDISLQYEPKYERKWNILTLFILLLLKIVAFVVSGATIGIASWMLWTASNHRSHTGKVIVSNGSCIEDAACDTRLENNLEDVVRDALPLKKVASTEKTTVDNMHIDKSRKNQKHMPVKNQSSPRALYYVSKEKKKSLVAVYASSSNSTIDKSPQKERKHKKRKPEVSTAKDLAKADTKKKSAAKKKASKPFQFFKRRKVTESTEESNEIQIPTSATPRNGSSTSDNIAGNDTLLVQNVDKITLVSKLLKAFERQGGSHTVVKGENVAHESFTTNNQTKTNAKTNTLQEKSKATQASFEYMIKAFRLHKSIPSSAQLSPSPAGPQEKDSIPLRSTQIPKKLRLFRTEKTKLTNTSKTNPSVEKKRIILLRSTVMYVRLIIQSPQRLLKLIRRGVGAMSKMFSRNPLSDTAVKDAMAPIPIAIGFKWMNAVLSLGKLSVWISYGLKVLLAGQQV